MEKKMFSDIGKYPRVDYSNVCTMDDDHDPHCWSCIKFVFPIGCMDGEEGEDYEN